MPDLMQQSGGEPLADIERRMESYFGLPAPKEHEYPEVFGWYHVADNTRYWVHDPATGKFTVLTSDWCMARHHFSGQWSNEDLEEVNQLLDSLQFLPRPDFPADLTQAAKGKPFTYEGWLFAWFYTPELRRWELGVIERRWQTEPKASGEAGNARQGDLEEQGHKLSLATKAREAGAKLMEQYSSSMLLVGSWNAPGERDGYPFVAGAALAASSRFQEPTDVVRAVSKATGCEERVVQSVIDYLEVNRLYAGKWFRPAKFELIVPDFY